MAADVLCAGLIVADHVCAPIARIPAAGELEMTPAIELAIGGCAANVAVDLTKLGVSAALAGCVGEDPLGRLVCDALSQRGVDCRHVAHSRTAQTATTMVVNVRGEDRRFIHAAGANAEFTTRGLDAALQGVRVVCVGGFGLNAALSGDDVATLFAAARSQGVTTLLDVVVGPHDVRPMLAPVLPLTDLFLPNQDEARVVTGLDDPADQVRRFREAGAATVVITRGPQGAVAGTADRTLSIPAYDVEQVDGTGGGDAFVAGFVYGLLRNASLVECLCYGAAMGASCVQAPGATTGVFDAAQLEKHVTDHRLPVNPLVQTSR